MSEPTGPLAHLNVTDRAEDRDFHRAAEWTPAMRSEVHGASTEGGWWKNNERADRAELPLRYSLIVSLRTAAESVDLYTPIAAELAVPVAAKIEGS